MSDIQRRSINVSGYSHVNPIPVASRVGNLLMSGVITGRDPLSGEMPASVEDQCAYMFGTVRRVIEAAGGTPDNIIKINIWLRDASNREALNREWLKLFPDEQSRPARHTLPLVDAGNSLVQCDVTAVFAD